MYKFLLLRWILGKITVDQLTVFKNKGFITDDQLTDITNSPIVSQEVSSETSSNSTATES
jgi:hypothetical protein